MTESIISRVYYGFNQDTLFIRADPKRSFAHFFETLELSIQIIKPFPFKVIVSLKDGLRARLLGKTDGDWLEVKETVNAAVDDIFECAIPFKDINAKEHDEVDLFLSVRRGNEEIERCPWRGYISMTVPTPDFEAMMWF